MNFQATLNSIGNSPALKAAASQVAGAVIPVAMAAVQAPPSGGFLAWLGAHPYMLPIYGFLAQAAYAYLSKYHPPAPVAAPPAQ